jgi:hypothetical protein
MADYPSRVISGGAILRAQSKSISRILQNGSLGYAARFSSVGYRLLPGSTLYGLSKGRGLVITSTLPVIQSPEKIYFNNGFSQDSQNVYLSKTALGLSIGFNLSLESLFVALILQWLNRKQGSEQKIDVLLVGDGDKNENYIYFTVEVRFKKLLTVIDDYEVQPVFTLTPLDF